VFEMSRRLSTTEGQISALLSRPKLNTFGDASQRDKNDRSHGIEQDLLNDFLGSIEVGFAIFYAHNPREPRDCCLVMTMFLFIKVN